MILADKIIALRKKNGWSQEELAEKLDVSRQSVSKWEGGLSIPDMNKIIGMSALFGVSTDYLLKDELEEVTASETHASDDSPTRQIGAEEANRYLDSVKKRSLRIAVGVALCILSPIMLILLSGFSEEMPSFPLPETGAVGIGIAALFLLVASAVVLFIMNGLQLEEFSYLEKESFTLAYGVKGIVEKKQAEYRPHFLSRLTVAVVLLILSVVPLVVLAALELQEYLLIACVGLLLAVCAVGVAIIVRISFVNGSFQRLLQTGEFTEEQKKQNRKNEAFESAYWCLFTAVYLGISFCTMAWHLTWIVWPVAAGLYPLFLWIKSMIVKR